MLSSITFVLGGAASGKSQVAEELIVNSGLTPVYLATARIWDAEVQKKVDLHRARRTEDWSVIDADVDLVTPLGQAGADQAVLLDCVTMWLTNLIMDESDIELAQTALLTSLAGCPAKVVVVSNEVGQGIVPDNALARRFREAQGRLNIALAAQATCVLHVVAGLVRPLKGKAP